MLLARDVLDCQRLGTDFAVAVLRTREALLSRHSGLTQGSFESHTCHTHVSHVQAGCKPNPQGPTGCYFGVLADRQDLGDAPWRRLAEASPPRWRACVLDAAMAARQRSTANAIWPCPVH